MELTKELRKSLCDIISQHWSLLSTDPTHAVGRTVNKIELLFSHRPAEPVTAAEPKVGDSFPARVVYAGRGVPEGFVDEDESEEPSPADAQGDLVTPIGDGSLADKICEILHRRIGMGRLDNDPIAKEIIAVAHAHPPAGWVTVEERDAQWVEALKFFFNDEEIAEFTARLTAPPKPTKQESKPFRSIPLRGHAEDPDMLRLSWPVTVEIDDEAIAAIRSALGLEKSDAE